MENGSRLWAAAAQPKVVLALLRNEIAKEKRTKRKKIAKRVPTQRLEPHCLV
jgi:hypothetical protein